MHIYQQLDFSTVRQLVARIKNLILLRESDIELMRVVSFIERSNFFREDPDQTISDLQLNTIQQLHPKTLANVPRYFGSLPFLEMVGEEKGESCRCYQRGLSSIHHRQKNPRSGKD